jgi:hypothetical protein
MDCKPELTFSLEVSYCLRKNMAKTNTFKWCQYAQFFTINNLFKSNCHCKQIFALIFHIIFFFFNQLIFLKQSLQFVDKINCNNAFLFQIDQL